MLKRFERESTKLHKKLVFQKNHEIILSNNDSEKCTKSTRGLGAYKSKASEKPLQMIVEINSCGDQSVPDLIKHVEQLKIEQSKIGNRLEEIIQEAKEQVRI